MCLELRQLILTGVCSLVALLGEPAFATPHGVTLESVMSAPMPANLVAAPQGGRIAWMVEVRGRRNVWVAEPRAEGHSARQLTHYVDDDGLDLGELTWDARGETILYTRGSTLDFGSQRTNPLSNPTSSPQGGAPWELWAVSVKPGAAPHKLAEGRMASVSPKGNLVAYLREDHIWVLSLDGTVKPHQLIHDQGDSGGHAFSKPPPLVWSPDGARLAFVSQRGDHNFIGVYDVAQRSVTWMVPSVDMDSKASWSADGRRIAFIRIPSGSGLFAEAPGTWSIWVADAASGAGHAVWHADSGPGGAFTELDAMKAESPLFWTADDHIVFPWEKTGWTQL